MSLAARRKVLKPRSRESRKAHIFLQSADACQFRVTRCAFFARWLRVGGADWLSQRLAKRLESKPQFRAMRI